MLLIFTQQKQLVYERKMLGQLLCFSTSREKSPFLDKFLTYYDSKSCVSSDHLNHLNLKQHELQMHYGKLGKAVPHRFTGGASDNINSFIPDMRFMPPPSRDGARFPTFFKETEELINSIDSKTKSRGISLCDSTAKGKTATLFQLCQHQFILYIVASIGPISEDQSYKQLFDLMSYRMFDSPVDKVEQECIALTKIDLLSRLALLHRYLEACLERNEAASPKTFLLLQLNREGNSNVQNLTTAAAEAIPPSADVRHALNVLSDKIQQQLKDLQRHQLLPDKTPLRVGVVIDEAQAAVGMYCKEAPGPKNFSFRSILGAPANMLYHLVDSALNVKLLDGKDFVNPLVLAGTGYTKNVLKEGLLSTAGKVKPIKDLSPLPFLRSNDILARWEQILDMSLVDTEDFCFATALLNLEGRPRASVSVIETHLRDVVQKYPHESPTQQLTRAMVKAFNRMKGDISETLECILDFADDNECEELLKKAFALLSVSDINREVSTYIGLKLRQCVNIAQVCTDAEINRLVELGLCFQTSFSDSTSKRIASFSEPLIAELVLSLGKQYNWDAVNILHNMMFRSVGLQTTQKNHEFERLVALELARFHDSTVAEFVGLFTENEVKLPPWTETAKLQFEGVNLVHSSTVTDDVIYLREALCDDTQSHLRHSIWLASNQLRPDLVYVNKEQGFVMLASVKWLTENQSGVKLVDNEASVMVKNLDQPKPSSLSKLAKQGNEVMQKSFNTQIAPLVSELEKLHELRILFVEPNAGKGKKNVKVDGNTVTIIVNKTNHHRFFGLLTVAALEAGQRGK